MKFLFLFLFPVMIYAQLEDTIQLKEVEIFETNQTNKFRPKYKKLERLTDHTNQGIKIISNIQLPKQSSITIKAIEFLFQSDISKISHCNEYFYVRPILIRSISETKNLLNNDWYEVEKDYSGRFIFPMNLVIDTKKSKNLMIGLETKYENTLCPEENGYIDLIEVKKKSTIYLQYNKDNVTEFKKQELFGNYSLNYILYYK